MKTITKENRILLAVLALQIVVLAIVFWPRPATSAARGKSLFEGVEAGKIVRITLRDMKGNQIEMVKKEGSWVLPEADDFPVRADKATDFVNKIAGFKADRVVTETAVSHKRLKVADDDYERWLEFELADGTKHYVYLGTSPSWSVVHARPVGQNRVYLVSLSLSDASTTISSWIDTKYVSLPSDQMVAVTLTNKNGTFEFTKDDAGNWHMKDLAPDEILNDNNVKSLASQAGSIYMSRPLGKTEKPEYGLSQPNAVVTVQKKDAQGNISSYTLTVGAKDATDNTYVVKSSDSPYYVRAAEYNFKSWIEWTRQDFLAPPPTATPTPAAQG